MSTYVLAAGLILALILLIAIYLKLDRLPLRVYCLVQRERGERTLKALDAMKEVVAIRAGASIEAAAHVPDDDGDSTLQREGRLTLLPRASTDEDLRAAGPLPQRTSSWVASKPGTTADRTAPTDEEQDHRRAVHRGARTKAAER
jgi:hypothetical protein